MHSSRANRLLCQVLDGTLRQHKFQPAELELLLDIVDRPTKIPRRTLRQYKNALARSAANDQILPPTLSEFIQQQARRRAERTAHVGECPRKSE